MTRPLHRTLLATVMLSVSSAAGAVELAPHRAVYDLVLSPGTSDLSSAEGRIAIDLESTRCAVYDLTYRFVARFEQDGEMILTDQQTVSTEDLRKELFEFRTQTFVDGVAETLVAGTASNSDAGTSVHLEEPEERSFDLPLSHFPLQHTEALVEAAVAGERFLETRLYDGDADGEKLLTSAALIDPLDGGNGTPAEDTPAAAATLADMRGWRVFESFYDRDSADDGLPIFRTSYVLYENGVSDDLVLDYGSYALEGGLTSLELGAAPSCP